MNTIILKDGTSYEIADNSTVEEIIVFPEDIDALAECWNEMTDENLSEFQIFGVTDTNRTVIETKVYKIPEALEAHFVTALAADKARLDELSAKITVLEDELQKSEDKATAYDILMGGETNG